jgi:hypothetical protein
MNTGFLPRVKQSEFDVDYSSPSSAMVENEWNCTSLSLCLPLCHEEGHLYLYLLLFAYFDV